MNQADILAIAKNRYTCKAYDADRKIDNDTMGVLLEMLRLSPSSINIQPWRFLVTDKDDTKKRITSAMSGGDAHNIPKILNASHVIILCTRTDVNVGHLTDVLNSELIAGRYADKSVMQSRLALCTHYIEYYSTHQDKLFSWCENQTFIALGQLLLSAQMLGINATPIGGYAANVLDTEFNLAAKNLKSSVIVSLGYASDSDANQTLPKARLPMDKVISLI